MPKQIPTPQYALGLVMTMDGKGQYEVRMGTMGGVVLYRGYSREEADVAWNAAERTRLVFKEVIKKEKK